MIEERINPSTSLVHQVALHQQRYKLACRYAKGNILDIACGTGYGCKMLSVTNRFNKIVGIDNSPEALKIAMTKYDNYNIFYQLQDAEAFHSIYTFDTVICFETIEHLKMPNIFLMKIKEYCKDLFIISFPLNEEFGVNPFHFHVFTIESAKELVSRYFTIKETMMQRDNIILICNIK